MFTELRRESGLTFVEISVALLVSALGGLALLATHDYFTKSRMNIEARSAHNNLRNLIMQTLSRKGIDCNNAVPPVCVPDTCLAHLKAKGGGSVNFPASKVNALEITEDDEIELSIVSARMGATTSTIALSTDPHAPPTDIERRDHLKYQLFLVGRYQEDGANERAFVGSISLVGHRSTDPNAAADLRASIPIKFRVSTVAPYGITYCEARTEERPIAGGNNTVDDCQIAGGVTVSTAIGNLCRFRSALDLLPPTSMCPSGFIGDPAVGCTVDPDADADQSYTIPSCPPMTAGTTNTVPPAPYTFSPPIAGVPDAVRAKGNQYCNYSGTPGGPNVVGDCPIGPNDPDDGWIDRSTLPSGDSDKVTFTVAENIRRCRYFNDTSTNPKRYFCDTTSSASCTNDIQPPSPAGDGATPVCKCPITACPNLDTSGNPISPQPWIQISSSPLKCQRNPALPVFTAHPPKQAVCGPGFTKVPDDVLNAVPSLQSWNDTVASTSISPGYAHILCQ